MLHGHGPSDAAKRRPARRSCSIFVTPPPYPGYVAFLGSIHRHAGQAAFCPYGQSIPTPSERSPPSARRPRSIPPDQESRFIAADSRTPPLASPENDSELQLEIGAHSKKSQMASASSGYGSSSASSESDQEISEQMQLRDSIDYRSSLSTVERKSRPVDRWRRRTVPVSLESASNDDVMRILLRDGHAILIETDVDSGRALTMETRGARRPETVMQLARRFGEIGAAQQNDVYRSRNSLFDGKENARTGGQSKSGPCTPVKTACQTHEGSIGGIASLKFVTQQQMSTRANIFKQMEKVNSSMASPRVMNPNSIKDALLRWVQIRVQGYPNVSVTNFSSSWADGLAFCALIHRFAPDAFDFNQLDPKNKRHNLELAFRVAEEHGICPLLEVDDMILMGDRPDWKCVFTYVQCFYKQFRDRP